MIILDLWLRWLDVKLVANILPWRQHLPGNTWLIQTLLVLLVSISPVNRQTPYQHIYNREFFPRAQWGQKQSKDTFFARVFSYIYWSPEPQCSDR
jgi:hypothetical protein